jgi:hypothetical protein
MWDVVEEALNIRVQDDFVPLAVELQDLSDRLVTSASGPETI